MLILHCILVCRVTVVERTRVFYWLWRLFLCSSAHLPLISSRWWHHLAVRSQWPSLICFYPKCCAHGGQRATLSLSSWHLVRSLVQASTPKWSVTRTSGTVIFGQRQQAILIACCASHVKRSIYLCIYAHIYTIPNDRLFSPRPTYPTLICPLGQR